MVEPNTSASGSASLNVFINGKIAYYGNKLQAIVTIFYDVVFIMVN